MPFALTLALQPIRHNIDNWDSIMMKRDERLTGSFRGQSVSAISSFRPFSQGGHAHHFVLGNGAKHMLLRSTDESVSAERFPHKRSLGHGGSALMYADFACYNLQTMRDP